MWDKKKNVRRKCEKCKVMIHRKEGNKRIEKNAQNKIKWRN